MEQPEKFYHEEIMDDIQLIISVYDMSVIFDVKKLQYLLLLEFEYKAPLYLLDRLIG